jgi:hypothetical protein
MTRYSVTVEANLRRRILACAFPSKRLQFVQPVSQEFCPTRRHDAISERRPARSIGARCKPKDKIHRTKGLDTYIPYPLGHDRHEAEVWTKSEQTRTNTASRSPIASSLKCRSSRTYANLILSQIISGYPRMRLASMSHAFFRASTSIKFDISGVPQLSLGVIPGHLCYPL